MCRIDSQLKIRLKYLIPVTPYAFPPIFSWHFSSHTPNTLSPMFSGIKNISFFVFIFTNLKKKILFSNIFCIDLILFQVKAL